MKVAVVGAGMAGLAGATALKASGHTVTLFDKGRRPGGRMSTRIATGTDQASFDHGAQFFTARGPAFRAQVARWQRDGCVAAWPSAGVDAWVGVPGMSAPVADLAKNATVHSSSRVEELIRRDGRWTLVGEGLSEEAFDAVVVAVPADQVADLVRDFDAEAAAKAMATPSQPCWTVMAAFASPLPVEADVVRHAGVVAWAARNSAKPGRYGLEAWVIQASPEWSTDHLEDGTDRVATTLLRSLADHLKIELPAPSTLVAHRWRYAKSGGSGDRFLWNEPIKLGICGDWLIGPKVESAWLSGTSLASVIGTS